LIALALVGIGTAPASPISIECGLLWSACPAARSGCIAVSPARFRRPRRANRLTVAGRAYSAHPVMPEAANFAIIDHPLIQHKLSLMRARETPTGVFRALMREVGLLLGYEATRDLPLAETEIETPLETARLPVLAGKKLCLVSILRAGNGLLDGMLELVPSARVGHIGLYRDPQTLAAVEYYAKLPDDLSERDVILVDPMLATGNSAVAAIARLKQQDARSIKFVCLVAAPEGVATVHGVFPDVMILSAALDRCLDDHGYILPGLGDAGDRLFGTK